MALCEMGHFLKSAHIYGYTRIIISYFTCVELLDESLIISSVAITTNHPQPKSPDSGVDTEGLSCVFTKLLWLDDGMGKMSLLRNYCFTYESSFIGLKLLILCIRISL